MDGKKMSAFQMKKMFSAVSEEAVESTSDRKKRKSRSKSRDTTEKGQNSPREKHEDDPAPSSSKKRNKKVIEKEVSKDVITVSDDEDKDDEIVILDEDTETKSDTERSKKKRKSPTKSKERATRARREVEEKNTEQDNVEWSDFGGAKPKFDRTAQTAQDENIIDDEETAPKQSPFVIEMPSGVIVAINHPSTYTLKGKVRMRVLYGSVDILGYRMTKQSSWQDIFSPDCSSLLTLTTTCEGTDVEKAVKVVVKNCDTFAQTERLRSTLRTFSSFCILEFQKLASSSCDFIASFSVFKNLLKPLDDRSPLNTALSPLGISLVKYCEHSTIDISPELEDFLDQIKVDLLDDNADPLVIMLCGGKDSGKSTTSRLLVNTLLNRLDCLYFLECDVGQTEFTPSGVVSLVKISEPVFGQPFCHQREPVCAFMYGGLSPRESPSKYLRALQSCVHKYESLPNRGPLVVNTMGWMKDLGYQVLVDTARLIHPTHILQHSSNQRSANISPLAEEFHRHTSWTDLATVKLDGFTPGPLRQTPIICQMYPVVVNGNTGTRLRPADHRNLSLLSHLSNDLEPGLTFIAKEPFFVPWKEIAVHVSFSRVPKSQVMYALNASVVALCNTDTSQGKQETEDGPLMFDRLPPCTWLGYGIVRAIDPAEKLLYVTTSVSQSVMASVNTLVKTAVTIPDELLLSQRGDTLPYVSEKVDSVAAGSLKPRRYMPRRDMSRGGGHQDAGSHGVMQSA